MSDPLPLSPELDALWQELIADALASDGRISDADVKNAVKRARPRIEQEARTLARTLDVDVLALELDRHWLTVTGEGVALCTCDKWTLDVSDLPIPELGERLLPFSRHVAEALRDAGTKA